MGPNDFDSRFDKLLGPAAARALRLWAAAMGLNHRLSQPFVNGRSTATVAAVFERSAGHAASKIILKHDQVTDDEVGSAEYARQRAALSTAGAFSIRLTALTHEPIGVADGSWIVFQNVAGGSLADAHVLTSLVACLPGMSLSGIVTEDVQADSDALVRACSTVVGEILARWSGVPRMKDTTVSGFLRDHLADRMQPGKSMAELARRWKGNTITLDGEPGPLPNPFVLVDDPPLRLDTDVAAIVGHGHGDLHTENVLVRPDGSDFWLIDLSRYRPDAPLTQDPVQLTLSIVNRTLHRLTQDQRELLLRVLASGGRHDSAGLPPWLCSLIETVRDTAEAWIAPHGLTDEWRRATLLSTVACSLIYAARASTSRDNQAWFLRLAARAGAAVAGRASTERETVGPAEPGRPAETGLAELCAHLYDLRETAGRCDRTVELERLVSRARLGHDIREDLGDFTKLIDVDLTRAYISDLDSRPTAADRYRCPLSPSCGRMESRDPGAAEPFCHVALEAMVRAGRVG